MLEIKNPIKQYIYNYCFHMRRTCIVVNPRALAQGKTTFRWLTTWCSPHMKAITVLIYRNYSKMFITWMFCFAEDNEIISGIENTITEPDWKKTGLSTHFLLSGVADRQQPTVFLYIIYFLSPSLANFP
jgi:hypothetical protein